MSVSSSVGGSVAKSVASAVTGLGGGLSLLGSIAASPSLTPSEGDTVTLTWTDESYPAGTYTLDDSTPDEGDTINFGFTPATLTYQWAKDGSDLVGETTNVLTLTNVDSSDDGTYSLLVTRSDGVSRRFSVVLAVHVVAVTFGGAVVSFGGQSVGFR